MLKRKIQQLARLGYTEAKIAEYADNECLTFAAAVDRLFKHEQQMLDKQATFEFVEFELKP